MSGQICFLLLSDGFNSIKWLLLCQLWLQANTKTESYSNFSDRFCASQSSILVRNFFLSSTAISHSPLTLDQPLWFIHQFRNKDCAAVTPTGGLLVLLPCGEQRALCSITHTAGKMSQHIISVNKVNPRQSSPFQGQDIEFTDTFFVLMWNGFVTAWFQSVQENREERDHLKNTLVRVNF